MWSTFALYQAYRALREPLLCLASFTLGGRSHEQLIVRAMLGTAAS